MRVQQHFGRRRFERDTTFGADDGVAQMDAAADAELRAGLAGLKCRCGTHLSIMRAVKRAAQA